jgi:predicted Zn-dependent protease
MNIYFFLFLIFTSAFVSGCSFWTAEQDIKGQKALVSKIDEPSQVKKNYPDLIWGAEGGGGEYYDPYLRDYLHEIVKKVYYAANNSSLPINFAIQNTSVPNAWAIPGCVVVTRGLLVNLQSEAEFAFIAGREISRLSVKNFSYNPFKGGFPVFNNLSPSDYDSGTIFALGSLSSGFLIDRYTINEEYEAVQNALRYVSSIGYDPGNGIKALINSEKAREIYLNSVVESPKERGLFGEFLASHPAISVKTVEMQRLINSYPPSRLAGDGEMREPFNRMLQKIRNVHGIYVQFFDKSLRYYENRDYSRAQQLLFAGIQKDPNQSCFYVLNGLIYLKINDLNGADEYFNRAKNHNSNYQPALSGLGQLYYKKGYFENSIDYLREAVFLFPDDVISNLYLGMGLFKLQKYREAILYLEKVANIDKHHQFANGFLGVCYENIGDTQTAYNYYLKQTQINPNNEAGSIALKKISLLKKK